ncbi:unnamed protein product [Peronospora belbahrii]|uniref:RING-type domain-containing protein n=1 Tax=Peronospora belbahrii TaxID=622444 RepID=A0ABN8CLQ9_9STRA|nr:unnamed protein product [Peronospora belbahrii]
MLRMRLITTGGLGVAIVVFALSFPQAIFPLILTFGLPIVMYGIISLLELAIMRTKHEWMENDQQQRIQTQLGVIQISRTLYEQLDSDVLQLLMSTRDFDGNDYERLMRLQELNERQHESATLQKIQQLPIVIVTNSLLQAFENARCTVCLSAFQVGDRVRMMPCFDRFHPECIDPWLREKGCCPICKLPAIT